MSIYSQSVYSEIELARQHRLDMDPKGNLRRDDRGEPLCICGSRAEHDWVWLCVRSQTDITHAHSLGIAHPYPPPGCVDIGSGDK